MKPSPVPFLLPLVFTEVNFDDFDVTVGAGAKMTLVVRDEDADDEFRCFFNS